MGFLHSPKSENYFKLDRKIRFIKVNMASSHLEIQIRFCLIENLKLKAKISEEQNKKHG